MIANVWQKSWWTCLALLLLCTARAAAIDEEIGLDMAPPVPGSLVICGGGDVPDSVMLRFIELAGGPAARIVFIPTAAEAADQDEVDEDLEFFRHQRLASLTVLHTRDRRLADDPNFVRPLENATGVWMGGGCQRLLVDVYGQTSVERELQKVYQRGGTIGGISAGAAAMSPLMIRGGFREPETGPGFGLLPGTVIDQHFIKRGRQDRLLRVLSTNPGFVGIGIDEGTALVVQGSRLSVMGDSCVVTLLAATADSPEEVTLLQPGEEADLTRLVRSATTRAQPVAMAADLAPVIASVAIVTPTVTPKRSVPTMTAPIGKAPSQTLTRNVQPRQTIVLRAAQPQPRRYTVRRN